MRTVLEKPKHKDPHTASMPAPPQQGLREGDWDAYRRALSHCTPADTSFEAIADAVASKRQYALAYLGKRAMLHGGTCSRTTPRILTQQLVLDLEENNRSKRYARYPWLETLMKLLAEIEVLQEQHASNNVISLVKTGER